MNNATNASTQTCAQNSVSLVWLMAGGTGQGMTISPFTPESGVSTRVRTVKCIAATATTLLRVLPSNDRKKTQLTGSAWIVGDLDHVLQASGLVGLNGNPACAGIPLGQSMNDTLDGNVRIHRMSCSRPSMAGAG